jgi:hypothetical protein
MWFKMAVFWIVPQCNLVEEDFIIVEMGTASISETSVNFYQTTYATNLKTAIFILAAIRI